jgi:hypothetical protein
MRIRQVKGGERSAHVGDYQRTALRISLLEQFVDLQLEPYTKQRSRAYTGLSIVTVLYIYKYHFIVLFL